MKNNTKPASRRNFIRTASLASAGLLGTHAIQAQALPSKAKDYNAIWIPYQKVFDEALKEAPAAYWCPDGVHPSIAGGFLMANAWVKGFELAFKK